MIKVFCWLGWHSWEDRGTKRGCKHCGKRQVFIRVGNSNSWEDV